MAAKSRPRVFMSGSAVGYYGDRTDELLTEASSTADDFLARLCRRWECAAQEADRLGARVVRYEPGLCWVGPAARWRRCCRRSS